MSLYTQHPRLCPTAGCPSCLDDDVRSNNDYETEVYNMDIARAMMTEGITGFQSPAKESRSLDCQNPMHYLCNGCLAGWLQHNTREKLQNFRNHCIQCDEVHPKTRNKGMAGPVGGKNATEVDLQNERAEDKEPWFTIWEAKMKLYTSYIKCGQCVTLSDVILIMKQHSAINKTKVAPSLFVHNSANDKVHNGLFVKPRSTVYIGEICAVLCSNQKRKYIRPLKRQSYVIPAVSKLRREYFLLFSINEEASIIGAAANGHFYKRDPVSNAIYKQLPIIINGKFLMLTVLIATSQINSNCEVVMDYGSGFGKDIAEPMDLNSQDDDDDDEEEEEDEEDEDEDDE